MGLTAQFIDAPFYRGGATSGADVPGRYPVGLNGRGFLVDLDYPSYFARFHHQSIPLLRPQQDASAKLGERSLNPESLWRSSQDDWSHGAGQIFFDRKDSDEARFRSSKGIDPWTKWQISLLPDTASKKSSVNTNLTLVTAGSYLYLIDGSGIYYTTDVTVGSPTWTSVTGGPATAPVSVASDGNTVYTAHTGNGIYKTTRGTATTASYATGSVTLVGYVKGRLMAAYQNNLYNVTGAGALPSALFTHGNSDFTWVGFGEGRAFIYIAGYSGDKSLVYATQIKSDGTALNAPFVAAELPDGEVVRSIQGYLGGYIMLGTDKGVRFCLEDSSNGGLQVGKLITTTTAVRCFEPQDRFVWFGWDNYDATSTGLGRMDLSVFADTLEPAYASDLMATAQGAVLSVVTFQNIRVFTVSGVGVFAQDTNYVASGTVDSGFITYDLADVKNALFLDTKHAVFPTGSAQKVWLAGDDGVFNSIGQLNVASVSTQLAVNQVRAQTFEIREELDRGSDHTKTPALYRHTLKAEVTADPGANILVPLLIADQLQLSSGGVDNRDINDDLNFIKALRTERTVVQYQEGAQTYQVVVDDYDWLPHHLGNKNNGYAGTCVAKLKLISNNSFN